MLPSSAAPPVLRVPSNGDAWQDFVMYLSLIMGFVLGLFKLLFGYRVCKLGVAFNFFGMIAMLTYCLLVIHERTNLSQHTKLVVSCIAGGVAGTIGVTAAHIFKPVYVLWSYGAILGLFLGVLAESSPLFLKSDMKVVHWNVHLPVVGFAIIGCSALTVLLPRPAIIVSTSACGAFAVIAAIEHFESLTFSRRVFYVASKVFDCSTWFGLRVAKPSKQEKLANVYVMFICWLQFTIIGVLFQVLGPTKGYRHDCKPSGDEEEDHPLLINTRQQPPTYGGTDDEGITFGQSVA